MDDVVDDVVHSLRKKPHLTLHLRRQKGKYGRQCAARRVQNDNPQEVSSELKHTRSDGLDNECIERSSPILLIG